MQRPRAAAWWSGGGAALDAAGAGFTKPVGTGPVPVWAGIKSAQIQNLNLNSKK